ncbi:MAG: AMP-binding protein, partial [Spirochaetia bacterium]|nr:AMP-binding protein [Spirochaetia bacterium]
MDTSRYEKDLYSASLDFCGRYSDNVLMRFEGRTLHYGEFLERIKRRAAFLQQNGFGKGDFIGIMSVNSPEWCATFIAISAIGAVVLPLDVSLQEGQLKGMLKAASAKAIFMSGAFKKLVNTVPVFDIDSEECYAGAENFKPVVSSHDDIAVLLFTSGTTGTPKMVSLTHMNILHIAIVCSDFEEFTPSDVSLALLPLFHVYALEASFWAPFVSGGSIVMLNSLKGPDIMKALGEYPITIFPAAPIMWELFFKALVAKTGPGSLKYYIFMFFVKNAPILRRLGLGFLVKKIFTPVHAAFGMSHRFFISGGAPLKTEYFIYFKNMGFNFIEGYGLSETTGPISIPYYKTATAGNVGKPIWGNKVAIRNINTDGIGEVWLRGHAVMKGYYNNPQANAEVFDSEGFFNTGDLGRVDKKGNLSITGRVKNVIVLDSGKNVYPEELEFYFKQSDMISEIAVFDMQVQGVTQVYAVINPVSKSRKLYSKMKAQMEILNKGLPEYRRIHHFAISLDELPKNSTRKLLYGEIKKLLADGSYQTSESDSAVLRDILIGASLREEEVAGFFRVYFNEDMLYANQSLNDFSVDSLGMIEFITALEEKFEIDVDIKEIWKKQNLAEITAYIASIESSKGASLDEKILSGPYKRKPRRFYNPLYYIFFGIVGFLSRRLWHVKIHDRERLEEDNAVFVANHQSFLDMIWISFCIPGKFRRNVYVTGKKKFAFLRFLFPVFPVLSLDDTNSVDVLKANADLLRQGKSLFIFPEGTRTPDGSMG